MTIPTTTDRRRTTTTASPEATSVQTRNGAHVVSTSHVRIPSSPDAAPTASKTRGEQDAHLRDERLDEREGRCEHHQDGGEKRELQPGLRRVRDEDLGCEHQHDPVARGCAPLQVSEVAAAVLEQRALVDHGQLEVRVRVVDGLATGLGEDDERETDCAEREPRRRPDRAPRCPCDHSREVGRPGDQSCDGEGQHEGRLGEHADREVTARSHEREPVRRIPGRGPESEACECEEAAEREHAVPDAEIR